METVQLELDVKIDGQPIPPACIYHDVSSRLSKLRKKVFTFATSEKDEKYFINRITNYLLDKDKSTLSEVLWDATWIRNDKGKFCKYLYFNEYIQRLYLDRDFFEWAKLMCNILENELEKLDSFNNGESPAKISPIGETGAKRNTKISTN